MAETTLTATDLDERAVLAARDGNEAELLIEEFQPFLRGCVARYASSATGSQSDDLFSVAMLAFYEAIQNYQATKGHFFSFASFVIRRRIIDELRKVYRREPTLSIDDEGDDTQAQSAAIAHASFAEYEVDLRRQTIALEIEQFKAELDSWGITLADLVQQSPKHTGLRVELRGAIARIAENGDIMQTLLLKRYFPVKKAAELTGLSAKKLERARSYILASLVVLIGDYTHIASYVQE